MFNNIRLYLLLFISFINLNVNAKDFFKYLKNIISDNNPLSYVPQKITRDNLSYIKKEYIDNFHAVQTGAFYRSAQLSAKTLDSYIKKYKIKTVINLRGEHPESSWWVGEKEVTQKNGVEFFNIDLNASKLTGKNKIRKILKIFGTAPHPMLVHCKAGRDRAGEVSALWALDQQHQSNKKALEQLFIKYGHNPICLSCQRFFD